MPSPWDQFAPISPSQVQGQVSPLLGNQNPDGGAIAGINPNLTGEDYLKQFAPEEQALVKDFVAGRRMPTGNPRRQDFIRMVASKYGADIGMPADDTTFTERRQLRTQLSSGSPASMGGQLRNGTTAMDHLAKVAEAAAALHNYDLGVSPLSRGANYLKGFTTENSAAGKSLSQATEHYGQEITKFYAGSPGGVAERERFLKSLAPTLSPRELASVIEQELNLIPGKMDQIREEVRTRLGPFVSDRLVEDKLKEQEHHRSRIEAALAKLRGETGSLTPGKSVGPIEAPAAAAPAAAVPAIGAGAIAVNPTTGERIRFENGAWVPVR